MNNKTTFIRALNIFFAFIVTILMISFALLFSYTVYLNRTVTSHSEQIKKLTTQLTAIKEASAKQAESSQEIQSKLNNINTSSSPNTNVSADLNTLGDTIKTIVKIYNISNSSTVSGTGTLIDNQGHILTNKHVIEESNSYYSPSSSILAICLTVSIDEKPKCSYTAEIVAIGDGDIDLAILKIDKKLNYTSGKFSTSTLGSNDLNSLKYKNILLESNTKAELKSPVNVIGYPGVGGDSISLTQGIYSGNIDQTYFKTDAKVNSGNSGGAAFDNNNRFLGVPTAVSGGQGNIGYIIKAQVVIDFIKQNIISN
jgi:S1-C subfamily serine protease